MRAKYRSKPTSSDSCVYCMQWWTVGSRDTPACKWTHHHIRRPSFDNATIKAKDDRSSCLSNGIAAFPSFRLPDEKRPWRIYWLWEPTAFIAKPKFILLSLFFLIPHLGSWGTLSWSSVREASFNFFIGRSMGFDLSLFLSPLYPLHLQGLEGFTFLYFQSFGIQGLRIMKIDSCF